MNRLFLGRIVAIQILTVLVLLGACSLAAYNAYAYSTNIQSKLAELEPRYARLLGMVQKQAEIAALNKQIIAQVTRLVYPASLDVTKSANEAQQRVRTIFTDNKLDINSIQVLPAKQEGSFDRIQISLRIEGNLNDIQKALASLAGQTPMIVIDNLAMQTIGAVKPASVQRLGIQLTLSTFRIRA